MKEIKGSIEIEATIDRVWKVLMDFASYPEWNPFIRRISGEPKVNSRIEIAIRPPGRREMIFHPELKRLEPNQEIAWLGSLLIKGLFVGEHHLSVESIGPNRTCFVQRESFSGILVPFLGNLLRDTQKGFEQMNGALKLRAERSNRKQLAI